MIHWSILASVSRFVPKRRYVYDRLRRKSLANAFLTAVLSLLSLASMGLGAATVLNPASATADSGTMFGVSYNTTYFGGKTETCERSGEDGTSVCNFLAPNGESATDLNDFITDYQRKLDAKSYSASQLENYGLVSSTQIQNLGLSYTQTQLHVGAAYTIATMLDPRHTQPTITLAELNSSNSTDFSEWKQLVTNIVGNDVPHSSCGVTWNENFTYTQNTEYDPGSPYANGPDVTAYSVPQGSKPDFNSIIFKCSANNSSGYDLTYGIKRNCANVVGDGATEDNIPIKPPTINASTSVSLSTVGPHQSMTFTHDAINNTSSSLDPDDATYAYRVSGCYIDDGGPPGSGSNADLNSCNNPTSNNNASGWDNSYCGKNGQSATAASPCPLRSGSDGRAAPSGGDGGPYKETYTFPSNAQNGDEYCQRLDVNPTGNTEDTADNPQGNGWYSDNGVCVTYQATTVTTKSEVSLSSTTCNDNGADNKQISTGQTVCFNHEIDIANSGPATAHYSWRVQGCYYSPDENQTSATCKDTTTNSNWVNNDCTTTNSGAGSCTTGTTLDSGSANCSKGNSCPSYTGGNAEEAYTFPANANPLDTYCERIEAYNVSGSSTDTLDTSPYVGGSFVCVTLEQPPQCPSSVTTSVSPKVPEPGEAFAVSANFPSADSGDKVVLEQTSGSTPTLEGISLPTEATTNSNGVATFAADTGEAANSYPVEFLITIGSTTSPCYGTLTVADLPVFKVLSGGIAADVCSGDGVLGGWNNNDGTYPPGDGDDFGSSSAFQALASGQITGFASNQTRFGNSPSALSFANLSNDITTSNSGPLLGGNYGSCQSLPTPIQDDPQEPEPNSEPATLPDTTGQYDYDPSNYSDPNSNNTDGSYITVIPGGAILTKQTVSIFVVGDAYIDGNILYCGDTDSAPDLSASNCSSSVGGGPNVGWTSMGDVPSFELYATGNIYIANSVTELDGIYDAGDNIYTCGDRVDSTDYESMPQSQVYSDCDNQLAVYGSFVAGKNINLQRTYGTLEDETPNTTKNPATASAETSCHSYTGALAAPTPSASCAAEVFYDDGEQAITTPNIASTCAGECADTVTSLPPIL